MVTGDACQLCVNEVGVVEEGTDSIMKLSDCKERDSDRERERTSSFHRCIL